MITEEDDTVVIDREPSYVEDEAVVQVRKLETDNPVLRLIVALDTGQVDSVTNDSNADVP